MKPSIRLLLAIAITASSLTSLAQRQSQYRVPPVLADEQRMKAEAQRTMQRHASDANERRKAQVEFAEMVRRREFNTRENARLGLNLPGDRVRLPDDSDISFRGSEPVVAEDVRMCGKERVDVHKLIAWIADDRKGDRPLPDWEEISGEVVEYDPELRMAIIDAAGEVEWTDGIMIVKRIKVAVVNVAPGLYLPGKRFYQVARRLDRKAQLPGRSKAYPLYDLGRRIR